jgi:exonuclease VII small subunit
MRMKDDRTEPSAENTALSSKKREASLPDLAAGKFQEGPLKKQRITPEAKESEKIQKKVSFKEGHEEGYPISKYRDCQDEKILDNRDENQLYKDSLEDFIEAYESAFEVYKKIKKYLTKMSIDFAKESFAKFLGNSEEIVEERKKNSQQEGSKKKAADKLYELVDELTNMSLALNKLNAHIESNAHKTS